MVTSLTSFISSLQPAPRLIQVPVVISRPLYGPNPVVFPLNKAIGYPIIKVVQSNSMGMRTNWRSLGEGEVGFMRTQYR